MWKDDEAVTDRPTAIEGWLAPTRPVIVRAIGRACQVVTLTLTLVE
jgi:hypothetical protein